MLQQQAGMVDAHGSVDSRGDLIATNELISPETPKAEVERVATVGGSSRHRARPSVGRLLFLLAAALVSSAIGYAIARPNSPAAPRSTIRPDVIAAFRHLLGPPESAKKLAPYVEAVNARLATAIASGAVQTSSDDANLTPDGTASVSTIKVVSPTVATVKFAISDGGDDAYLQRFVGDVVATGGRWKISWATVCMLVEAESYVCPNPPTTLLGAVPLPHSLSAENETAHQEPGLLRPQALAVEPDGDLLIVDTDRDQILRWQPNGHLSIFAGTGQPGLGGVGGPAVDARLPGYFGAELAVSRDGTVFVTGGNACGLLVITPSGLLQRRLTQLCNVSGVTLSGSGTLYLTDGTGVYRASPSGALTELARSQYPPSPNAVTGMPSATGFSPSLLAFEGNGDLDIYSNGPRAIWRLTPASQLTDLGIAYAEGMATALDGTVLLAGHGGSIDRVTAHGVAVDIDLLSAKISGYGVPGMRGGFDPNGIAVAPNGTIFVDTFSGNGWTDATSVAAFPPHGAARQLAISTPVLETLPAPNAPSFPAAEYPTPVAPSGAGLSSCPSAKGLQPFAPSAITAMRQRAARFNAYVSSFWGDLDASDRSWWSGIVDDWTGGSYDNDTHTVKSIGPATPDTFAPVVASACGQRLVDESAVVVEGPSAYSFQVTHLFFLDRDGHPLVYFQAS